MAFNWFYDKHIAVLEEVDGYLYHGSWIDGGFVQKLEIVCDVQPANREQIFKDYGYYIDCQIRIFCDLVDISIGDIVEYNGQRYKIVKIIKWDDYLDVFAEGYLDGE